MKLPGQILTQNKWIVFISVLFLAIVTFPYASEDTYNTYQTSVPPIDYGNPVEASKEIFVNNFGVYILAMLGPLVFNAIPAIGFSLGALIWDASVNPGGIDHLAISILAFYSVFLSIFGGLFIMVKIAEKVWSILVSPRDISFRQVIGDYGSIFIFGVLTLFVSTIMTVVYGQAEESGAPVQEIVTLSVLISLVIIVFLSSNVLRRILSYLPLR